MRKIMRGVCGLFICLCLLTGLLATGLPTPAAAQSLIDLSLIPGSHSVTAGDEFDVIICVESRSHQVTEINVFLDFDPEKLRVIDTSSAYEGVQIMPGTALPAVSQNAADNLTGQVNYRASSAGNCPSDTFSLAAVRFQALKAVGSTEVKFSTSPGRVTRATGVTEATGILSSGTYTINPLPVQPSVVTRTISGLTHRAVTLKGNLKAPGTASTVKVSFEWGTTTRYGNTTPTQILTEAGYFETDLSALSSSTTYYYRAKAEGDGIVYGSQKSFTTDPKPNNPSGESGKDSDTSHNLYPNGFTTKTPMVLDSEYIIEGATRLQTADGNLTVEIGEGTKLLSKTGNALAFLKAISLDPLPAGPLNHGILTAYDFEPEGAAFYPGLTVTMKYRPAEIPAYVNEDNLFISYFDGTKWTDLKSKVDTKSHTVTATAIHFSRYAVLGKIQPPPPLIIPPTPLYTPIISEDKPIPAATAAANPAPTQTAVIIKIPEYTPAPTPIENQEKPFNWSLAVTVMVMAITLIIVIIRISFKNRSGGGRL